MCGVFIATNTASNAANTGYQSPMVATHHSTAIVSCKVEKDSLSSINYFSFSFMQETMKDYGVVNNSIHTVTLTERNTVSYLDFLTEKNAKNKAYAFILANGWLDDFADYCRCSPLEDCIRGIFFGTNTEDV